MLRSGASSGTGASAAVRGVAGRGTGSTVVAPRPGVGRSAADDEADAAAMRAWIDGDASAFDALHARHGDALWRFVRRGCADEAVARELYQDVWLRAIEHRGAWRPDGRVVAWLWTIARHRLVDHYRSTGRRPASEPGADPDATLGAVTLEDAAVARGARRARTERRPGAQRTRRSA